MEREDEALRLIDGARRLGVSIGRPDASRLIHFLDALYEWNRRFGFTKILRPEAVRLHLLDSISVAPLLDRGTVADLGAGAGLPGLPLSIVRPDLEFVLVESNRRRCSFLHEALRDLRISNAVVAEGDVRDQVTAGRRFDCVVSRAFRPPQQFLEIAAELLRAGGRAIVMRSATGSLPARIVVASCVELEFVSDRRFRLPDGPEERSLAVWRRVG